MHGATYWQLQRRHATSKQCVANTTAVLSFGTTLLLFQVSVFDTREVGNISEQIIKMHVTMKQPKPDMTIAENLILSLLLHTSLPSGSISSNFLHQNHIDFSFVSLTRATGPTAISLHTKLNGENCRV
jgi:hypothetical protein